MITAKDILVKPITAAAANSFMRATHYSKKVVRNSQLHFGVFVQGKLEGAIQLGPSLDKRKMLGLVEGTAWNGFLELNRMALSDACPRNSESRALGVVFRLIRKRYPHIKWIVSFADACQCGDGTIYRASGFVLTAIKKNQDLIRLADGTITHTMSVKTGKDRLAHYASTGGASSVKGDPLRGYQIRYIYFLDPAWRAKLAVPEIPFDRIREIGAAMYRGKGQTNAAEVKGDTPPVQGGKGGSTPTPPLHIKPAGMIAKIAGILKGEA